MLRHLTYGPSDLATTPIEPMTRFNWEFYANLQGALRATFTGDDATDFETSPTLWLFPPDCAHGWQSQGAVDRLSLHFSSVPDVIRNACVEPGFLKVELGPADVEMLRLIGNELTPHYRSPTPTSLLLFDRALINLSLLFLRGRDFSAALPLETVAVERVQRAIEWYLAHLHKRPTFDALADAVHISPTHLRRQFQLVHGQGPHLVLRNIRLERAVQMLATTDNTLEVIARSSGFNSASDFCRVFKRRFDVYPNQWRTQVSTKENPHQQLHRRATRGELKVIAPDTVKPPPTSAKSKPASAAKHGGIRRISPAPET
jgi:AraC family transcriptional regulator